MTLIDLVNQSAARLEEAGVAFGHGTTNAFDEAAWLVLWALGLPLHDLDGVADMALAPRQRTSVEELVGERIRSRKPAAYLTREAWLQGVPFYVDERVIVPRSFIAELLAGGGLDPWFDGTGRILDLCTGNGSLAVLAAMAYSGAAVVGADISADALAVARINVDRHGLQERIELVESDGLQALAGGFDLILCNPPYVNAASMQQLPAEFRADDGQFVCLEAPLQAVPRPAEGAAGGKTVLRQPCFHGAVPDPFGRGVDFSFCRERVAAKLAVAQRKLDCRLPLR